MTTQTLFERWLRPRRRGDGTIEAYGRDLAQFIDWIGANAPLSRPQEIETTDVTEYLVRLNKSGITGTSQARKLASIREYFRCLVEHDIIAVSPAQRTQSIRREKRVREFLSAPEYEEILVQANLDCRRDYAILQLLLQTGIRVSELCNLRIPGVDFKRDRVHFRGGKGEVDRGSHWRRRRHKRSRRI